MFYMSNIVLCRGLLKHGHLLSVLFSCNKPKRKEKDNKWEGKSLFKMKGKKNKEKFGGVTIFLMAI